MKTYLVGGAVRDQLLGIPVQERDFVVVGAKAQDLLQKGYRQVGRDFPVFLHPQTQEEYALARTERKLAPGYHGFACNTDNTVTLEQDLARRDLTINAMAMDDQGQVIDPYQGQRDLKNKILRHVSAAFTEDPVRVLRVARFAARFHYLGFTLAQETRHLMYLMVKNHEMTHLVAERIWQEWQKSLQERNPEQFIWTLRACDALRVILPEIDALFGVPNPVIYHKEIDSGIHSVDALKVATTLSDNPTVRFAALVHDLGKAHTPMSGWPKHYGHEHLGVPVVEQLCRRLKIPNEYRELATKVAGNHLTIHRIMELRASTVVKLLERLDAFRRPQLFHNVLLACQADAKACGFTVEDKHGPLWKQLLNECLTVNPQAIIAQGHTGSMIKNLVHERRVACVQQQLTQWKKNER